MIERFTLLHPLPPLALPSFRKARVALIAIYGARASLVNSSPSCSPLFHPGCDGNSVSLTNLQEELLLWTCRLHLCVDMQSLLAICVPLLLWTSPKEAKGGRKDGGW
jgi:hypothetical protein